MRLTLTATILIYFALSYACGGGAPTTNTRNAAPANTAQKTGADVTVASSHGGGSAAPASGSSDKPSVATPELDAKIQKAEAKAKAAGASDADKKAAADAYFERADFYRDQGMPVLYKFALRDYRIGLRLDPSNSDARGKMDEIVQIYKSLGRPVPDLGNEP